MSENEKNPNPGELISEEQLDAATGGFFIGTAFNPKRDDYCWFAAGGVLREDGRILCKTQCKGHFETASGPGEWRICRCWGTDHCIEKRHKTCGYNSRWG